MRTIAGVAACLALISCQRESREMRPAPAQLAIYGDAARQSTLQPGGAQTASQVTNPYTGQAWAINEGQRLYGWYNCVGCHAHGGGAIGPPLITQQWVYGGEPANLFDTIVKGRPNGMPSWGGRIPEYQVWQLVAYLRSLNGGQPQSATSARSDELEPKSEVIR